MISLSNMFCGYFIGIAVVFALAFAFYNVIFSREGLENRRGKLTTWREYHREHITRPLRKHVEYAGNIMHGIYRNVTGYLG